MTEIKNREQVIAEFTDYEQKAEEIFDEFVARQEEMERWEREEI